MVSDINSDSIDSTFPVAGKDNDSQGFRDNFSYIKDNFAKAKSEISNLQSNTAKLNAANDFTRNNILNANFVNCTENIVDLGIKGTNTIVDITNGPYQVISVTGDITLTLTGLIAIAGKLGKIAIHIVDDGTEHTVSFAIDGGNTIRKSSRVPGTITTAGNTDQTLIVEFWTYQGKEVVYMDYLGIFA